MKFQGFNSDDFTSLGNITKTNTHFKKLDVIRKGKRCKWWIYEKEVYENQARNLNRIVYDKMSALMRSIKDDLRFKNFEIKMCDPIVMAGRGRDCKYRDLLWISMVDKRWLKRIRPDLKEKAIPKSHLPQIQIDITSKWFTTAEIWFEPTAMNHYKKMENHMKLNFKGDNSVCLFGWKENDKDTKFDEIASKKNFNLFCGHIKTKKCNEAALYRYKNQKEVIGNINLVEQVKEDLIYIIKYYYEPVFGDILYKRTNRKNDKQRRIDIERKKKIESIGYEVISKYFEDRQYVINPVMKDNVGWDLEAVGNSEKLLLEVKALSGSNVNVELTPNEYENMKKYKKNYKVCVVTDALEKPLPHIYSYVNGVWTDYDGIKLVCQEKVALKMYWDK